MTADRIGLLFDNLPQLRGLNSEIRKQLALQTVLVEFLPVELGHSATVVASGAGELVLLADNGAVAAKLRQLAPRILNHFRQRGMEANGIRVQTQVSIRHKPLPQKQISLSENARQALLHLSSNLKDSPLKAAIEKLRQRADSGSSRQSDPLESKKN
jgi:hypothetical protein